MSETSLPTWVQFIAAIGPTAVAVSVAYVAWRQWRTAETKLKFDLFERRLKAYDAYARLWAMIAIHGEVSPGDYNRFIQDIDGAQFLFGHELVGQIEAIRDMAFRASNARMRYKNNPEHPMRGKLIAEEEEVLQYIGGRRDQLEHLFRQEMKLA